MGGGESEAELRRHGTIPGLGPPAPVPAGVSSDVVASGPAEAAAAGAGAVPDGDEGDVVHELGDETEMEEVDAGELMTSAQSARASGLPIGGEDGGAATLRPAPPEEPRVSIVDEAVADAIANDPTARAAELAAELEGESDRQRLALSAYELGEITERRLRDEAGAVKSFGRALQADPSLRPNLWAIRRVFYRRGLWPNLLKLIDAEVRFARSDAERADLLVEKAQVIEDRQGDVAAARDVFDKAIALDNTCRSALLGRERIALAERDNESLLRVWRLLADATETPARKVGYLIDAARLVAALALAGAPADREAALEEAQDIIAEATALGASPGVDAGLIARERERLAELGGDGETIVAAIEARIALVGTDHDLARTREVVALRRRQAQVLRGLGDRERSLRALELAAGLAPKDPLILYDLVDLAETSGDPGILAGALERLFAIELDRGLDRGEVPPGRELYLTLRRVEALAAAGRADEAESLRASVAEKAPGYLPFLERAQREALRRGDVAELAALRLEEAETARAGTAFGPGVERRPDPAWAAAALVAAGDLYAQGLDRISAARAAYEQALEVVPGYPPAVEGLLALHVADPDAAIVLLERELPAASGTRAEELLERLAGLYQDQGRTPSATATLERLAALRPDDVVLRFRLEHLYSTAGQHAERVPILEALAAKTIPARQAALLFEIGRIHDEHLGGASAAIDAHRRALAVDPQDRTLRGALLSLLRRAGRWDELVTELRAEADLADGPGAARALRTAAAILERRLGRPADAAELYRDLADRDPDDAWALRGLARTLTAVPEEQAAVLEREAATLPGGPAAGQAQVRLGDLFERLGRSDDAAAAYGRAQAEGGVGLHAHWALAELAARRGDRTLLASALGGIAERTTDDSVRAELLEELAWLTDDVDRSTELFADVARRAPDRRGALLGKALVAARKKDAVELAAAVIAQAEQTSDNKVAAALLLRAAALDEVTSGRGGGGRSAELAARALALDPDDAGALVAAVERPGVDGDERQAILARRGLLVDDLETRALDDVERAELAARAGRLAEAGRIIAGVLVSVPDHLPALLLLRRVAGQAGDNETVARTAIKVGRILADPTLAARSLADAAALLDGPLGRHDDAGAIWRSVFDLDPTHPVAYRRAHEIIAGARDRDRDREGLYDLLTRRIDGLGASADVIPYRLERAGVARQRRDDDAAADDLIAILELDPNHVGALALLAAVRRDQGDAPNAAALLRQHNEAVTDPEQRADGEAQLAEVLHGLGADDEAIESLDIVLTVRPDELKARERLVELLFATGDAARGAEELERLAARRTDGVARAKDELRAARVFRDRLKDPDRARKALERARAADPLALDAVRELADLLVGPERPALLVEAASAIRGRLDGSAAPLRALAQVAQLADDGPLAHATLGALVVLGAATDEERRALGTERQRAGERPLRARRAMTDVDWTTRLEHPSVRGPLGDAWAALAESAARAGEVDPAALGFTRGERIAARAIGKQAPVVETAQRLVGLGEIDLYVTAGRTTFARAIGLETPIVLLSADVARGESLEARALLGRTMAAARLRSAPVEDLDAVDLAILIAAGLKVSGADMMRVPSLAEKLGGQIGRLDERVRLLSRTLGRKEKKALAGLEVKLGPIDLGGWIAAIRATHRRAALLFAGDLPTVLGRVDAADSVARDVAAWGVSETSLGLRRDLLS